ncbi:unnamed protein product [Amoebophrya sp. A25]|nr:unnamed protein product [Amoebophrya sp. A25]|eukprot:GSA25T00000115001.1
MRATTANATPAPLLKQGSPASQTDMEEAALALFANMRNLMDETEARCAENIATLQKLNIPPRVLEWAQVRREGCARLPPGTPVNLWGAPLGASFENPSANAMHFGAAQNRPSSSSTLLPPKFRSQVVPIDEMNAVRKLMQRTIGARGGVLQVPVQGQEKEAVADKTSGGSSSSSAPLKDGSDQQVAFTSPIKNDNLATSTSTTSVQQPAKSIHDEASAGGVVADKTQLEPSSKQRKIEKDFGIRPPTTDHKPASSQGTQVSQSAKGKKGKGKKGKAGKSKPSKSSQKPTTSSDNKGASLQPSGTQLLNFDDSDDEG